MQLCCVSMLLIPPVTFCSNLPLIARSNKLHSTFPLHTIRLISPQISPPPQPEQSRTSLSCLGLDVHVYLIFVSHDPIHYPLRTGAFLRKQSLFYLPFSVQSLLSAIVVLVVAPSQQVLSSSFIFVSSSHNKARPF